VNDIAPNDVRSGGGGSSLLFDVLNRPRPWPFHWLYQATAVVKHEAESVSAVPDCAATAGCNPPTRSLNQPPTSRAITPLSYAAVWSHWECVHYLLKAGSDAGLTTISFVLHDPYASNITRFSWIPSIKYPPTMLSWMRWLQGAAGGINLADNIGDWWRLHNSIDVILVRACMAASYLRGVSRSEHHPEHRYRAQHQRAFQRYALAMSFLDGTSDLGELPFELRYNAMRHQCGYLTRWFAFSFFDIPLAVLKAVHYAWRVAAIAFACVTVLMPCHTRYDLLMGSRLAFVLGLIPLALQICVWVRVTHITSWHHIDDVWEDPLSMKTPHRRARISRVAALILFHCVPAMLWMLSAERVSTPEQCDALGTSIAEASSGDSAFYMTVPEAVPLALTIGWEAVTAVQMILDLIFPVPMMAFVRTLFNAQVALLLVVAVILSVVQCLMFIALFAAPGRDITLDLTIAGYDNPAGNYSDIYKKHGGVSVLIWLVQVFSIIIFYYNILAAAVYNAFDMGLARVDWVRASRRRYCVFVLGFHGGSDEKRWVSPEFCSTLPRNASVSAGVSKRASSSGNWQKDFTMRNKHSSNNGRGGGINIPRSYMAFETFSCVDTPIVKLQANDFVS